MSYKRFVGLDKKLLALLIFLGNIVSYNYACACNPDKKLIISGIGGASFPIGEFSQGVKVGFNWGGGVEYQVLPNWAIGSSVQTVDFKHSICRRDTWDSSWIYHDWTYTDWSFVRGNLYGKYIFKRTKDSPFLKLGIGAYVMEDIHTFIGSSQVKTRNNGLSLVPGAGIQYLTKKVLFFIEVDYNMVITRHMGGSRMHKQRSQFFDLLFGVGFQILGH
jgi:hypothetical protein